MAPATSAAVSPAAFDREPVNVPAVVLSVLVHALLFAFLYFGIHWHSKEPDAVYVELWNHAPVPPRPAPRPLPKPMPKVEPKPEPKVEPEPPPPPKVEATPVKPDIVVEKQKPQRKKVEPKKIEPRKPRPKKVRPKKVKPKRVEPPVLKFNRTKAIQQEAERDLQRMAPVTTPLPKPSGAPVADNSYVNRIKNKIRSNLVLPPDIPGNPEAIFDVVQLPTGDVISVKLRKSTGVPALDDAMERAILKSSPLPRPALPEEFVRELELKFRPKDTGE